MARSKIAPPDIIDVQIKQDALDHDRSAANQLALVQQETATRVRAVAQQLGYQLPVESADPDLIQRDIAANMRRSVEACLEVGRGLRVLKEACVHGNFMARLEVLGLEPRVAQRFMQSATNQTVDVILGLTLMVGGVVGAQFGARVGQSLRGETLRLLLGLLVLAVGLRFAVDLVVRPSELYSISRLGGG